MISRTLLIINIQKVIGFDTETKRHLQKARLMPFLVQLAGEDAAFIYQLDDISILKNYLSYYQIKNNKVRETC